MKLAYSLAALTAFAFSASAQLQIDPELAAGIAKIKTIDNHAHPVLPVWSGILTPNMTRCR